MIEFRRNKEGLIEAWKNGHKVGEVVTMGDMITKKSQSSDDEKPASKKKPTKTSHG